MIYGMSGIMESAGSDGSSMLQENKKIARNAIGKDE